MNDDVCTELCSSILFTDVPVLSFSWRSLREIQSLLPWLCVFAIDDLAWHWDRVLAFGVGHERRG